MEERMRSQLKFTRGLLAIVSLLILTLGSTLPASLSAAPAARSPQKNLTPQEKLTKEVRHELVMLPYYSVFDNLSYKVEGDHVTLMGQVTRPTLKSDAENVVKHIEGVGSVTNEIEVLPLSPNDDRIRRATYRAIYGYSQFTKYSLEAVPSIHIIVKNGNITLEGVVDSDADKNLAGIRANSVPGAFSVTNNLRVEK
jgi:hyperosmotically inducible protein